MSAQVTPNMSAKQNMTHNTVRVLFINTLDSQQNLEFRQLRRQMAVTEVSDWLMAKKNTMSC